MLLGVEHMQVLVLQVEHVVAVLVGKLGHGGAAQRHFLVHAVEHLLHPSVDRRVDVVDGVALKLRCDEDAEHDDRQHANHRTDKDGGPGVPAAYLLGIFLLDERRVFLPPGCQTAPPRGGFLLLIGGCLSGVFHRGGGFIRFHGGGFGSLHFSDCRLLLLQGSF